jgi:N utilization substance protein B
MLYAFEQKHYENDDALALAEDEEPSAAVRERALSLFTGFSGERTAIDACIDKRLQNWTLNRLAVMDRAVLRLGCYELLYCADVPASVVINEYIELAKQFGSDGRTAKLVNGVLDKIAREHRPDEVKPRK